MAEYVYVNSTFGLWRLRFEGKKLVGPVKRDKGQVTQMCSYEVEGVPLGAAVIRWKSKVFFVGGEKRIPDKEQQYLLNKSVYVCHDKDQVWTAKNPFVDISLSSTIPPCAGPKPIPFVVPLKSASKTLFCVIGAHRLMDSFGGPVEPRESTVFEIFDPESETWTTPGQPDPTALDGAYSVFELGGRVFLIGMFETSFSLESNKWEWTDYFAGQSVFAPMRTVAVDGLSDSIRIGIANRDGKVYAYKLLDENDVEPDGCRVAMQELPEVFTYLRNLFPRDTPIEVSLSSLGKGMVLFISSSFCGGRYLKDYLVHYYCLKLHFTELMPGGHAKPFVGVRVVDCCRRTVPMTDEDMHKVAFHIGMRSAFVL